VRSTPSIESVERGNVYLVGTRVSHDTVVVATVERPPAELLSLFHLICDAYAVTAPKQWFRALGLWRRRSNGRWSGCSCCVGDERVFTRACRYASFVCSLERGQQYSFLNFQCL
jgi:hypothetical protein